VVQIFERASISGEQRRARMIAEVWVVTSTKIGRGKMEEVMRRSSKYIWVKNEIYDLASLDDELLRLEISGAFGKVTELAEPIPGDSTAG
jgi:hypothetical protein